MVVEGEMVKVGAVTVTAAWPDFDESATLVAATVTVEGGMAAGAAYSPPLEIVPFVESPPTTPFTLQVTLVSDEPLTVAVNCWVWETCTEAFEGDTVTEIVGDPFETVTVALADFDESTVLITDTVTEAGDGRTAGAV